MPSPCTKPVLVVEDEPDLRETMQLLLEDEGYTVYLACNGQQALEVLRDSTRPLPGLVALDFYMPVMDGKAFIKALKLPQNGRDLTHLSVVLITASDAHAQIDVRDETIAVLQKPVDLDKLLNLVAHHCGTP